MDGRYGWKEGDMDGSREIWMEGGDMDVRRYNG